MFLTLVVRTAMEPCAQTGDFAGSGRKPRRLRPTTEEATATVLVRIPTGEYTETQQGSLRTAFTQKFNTRILPQGDEIATKLYVMV